MAYDIRSIWIMRPADYARPRRGINGIYIEMRIQADNSELWGIFCGLECLGKDGVWISEPLPSERDRAYLAQYRFASLAEAYEFAQREILGEIPSSEIPESEAINGPNTCDL